MKNPSNTWSMLPMLVCSALALSSILLIIYGIYQFVVTFLPSLLESSNSISQL